MVIATSHHSSASAWSHTGPAVWINNPEILLFARRFTMFQVMHEDLARAHIEQRLHAERSQGIRRGARRIAQQARAARRMSQNR
jgi:hypothetical protein